MAWSTACCSPQPGAQDRPTLCQHGRLAPNRHSAKHVCSQRLPAGEASPGHWKSEVALDQTLATVQAPVVASAHQPGWLGMNSAMHTHLQAVSEKLPAARRCVGTNKAVRCCCCTQRRVVAGPRPRLAGCANISAPGLQAARALGASCHPWGLTIHALDALAVVARGEPHVGGRVAALRLALRSVLVSGHGVLDPVDHLWEDFRPIGCQLLEQAEAKQLHTEHAPIHAAGQAQPLQGGGLVHSFAAQPTSLMVANHTFSKPSA